MRRLFVLIFVMYCMSVKSNSQGNSEYRYFSLKFGLTHNFLHPQPDNPIDKYIQVGNQSFQLQSSEDLLYNYSATFNTDILYHFDFDGDRAGIVTGIGYQNKKYVFEYTTGYYDHSLHDIYSTHQLSLPLFYKYGNDIWDTQRYFTLGARLNYNLAIKNKNNYQQSNTFRLGKNEYNPFSLTFLLGFNYHVYNFEIEYQVNSIFNKGFRNEAGNQIHRGQNGNFLFFKTTFHFPYGYLYEVSFFWRRLLTRIFGSRRGPFSF